MSAIAAIKVADTGLTGNLVTTSATVGVTRTFSPEGWISPGVARWVDRSGGIALGYPSVTLSLRPPTKTSRVYRVTCKVSYPRLAATSASTNTGIDPGPTLAYTCSGIMEFVLPERSTLAERVSVLQTFNSLFNNNIAASDGTPSDAIGSPLAAAVADFEQVY